MQACRSSKAGNSTVLDTMVFFTLSSERGRGRVRGRGDHFLPFHPRRVGGSDRDREGGGFGGDRGRGGGGAAAEKECHTVATGHVASSYA